MNRSSSARSGKRSTASSGCDAVGGGGVGGLAARPAASSRLETTDSNLNEARPVGFAALVPHKCRCRTCDKCGSKLGWRVRQSMLAKAHRFRRPFLFTLTVDRKNFESPEAAHRYVTENALISRLMKLLGVLTWFWVLEFQTKSGGGWPHWHLLIDLEDVGGFLDLKKAWRLWRDTYHVGGLDLDRKRRTFRSAVHAVLYITKYLTKKPEAFPPWVILRDKAIRFVGGCKSIGSLTGQAPRAQAEAAPVDQLQLPFRARRTILLIRMARCEMQATVFCVDGDCGTGDGEWSWMGTIPATVDDLVELAGQGVVSLRITAVEWGKKELWAITSRSIGGVVAAMKKARRELEDREVGYAEEWREKIADREWSILEHHANYWAARAA